MPQKILVAASVIESAVDGAVAVPQHAPGKLHRSKFALQKLS